MSSSRVVRVAAVATSVVLAGTAWVVAAPQHAPEPKATTAPTAAPADALATDDEIADIAYRDGRVYVRGSFTKIGRFTGPAVSLDPATGAAQDTLPRFDGQVSDAVSDGADGFYVAGDFSRVGDAAPHSVVHLLADGSVDPGFAPPIPDDAFVAALALHGDTLYLGGRLRTVGGHDRTRIAAVSADDGALLPFRAPAMGRVQEILYQPAGEARPARVVVGTDTALRALDAATGAEVATFDPDWDGGVSALALEGTRLYVGGIASRVVALDATTGVRDTGFTAPVDADNSGGHQVTTLQFLGGRLYAGGSFAGIGGTSGNLLVLDPGTGAVDPSFTPRFATLSPYRYQLGIYELALTPSGLWVGGRFSRVDGATAHNLALLDPTTGDPVPTQAPPMDAAVNALATGSRLLVGGDFYIAGYTAVDGLATLDAATLDVVHAPAHRDGNDFDVQSAYDTAMMPADRAVYIAQDHFEGYSTYPEDRRSHQFYYPRRQRILALDPATGRRIDRLTRMVQNLSGVTVDGDELVVVRRLESDVRFPHNRVAVYDADTGTLRRAFRVPLPGYVTQVVARPGGGYYLAGSFRRFREDGQPAHLAVLRLTPQGRLVDRFDPHVNGPVYDVATGHHSTYLSGLFQRWMSRRPLEGMARFDAEGILMPGFKVRNNSRYDRIDEQLRPFGARGLWVTKLNYRDRMIDGINGTALFHTVHGFQSRLEDITDVPGGIVYAAGLKVTVGGEYDHEVYFVARDDD